MVVGVLVAIHLLASIFLILIVLLQTGKGQDLASAFGGGGSNTVFGAAGAATFLHKMTVASAVVFMFTSLILSIIWAAPTGSAVSDSIIPPQNVEIPGELPATDQQAPETQPLQPSEEAPAAPQDEAPAQDNAAPPNEGDTSE